MDWLLAKHKSSSQKEMIHFVNNLRHPPGNAAEAEDREGFRLATLDLLRLPPESLSPKSREIQGFLKRNSLTLDPSGAAAGIPQEVKERKRLRQRKWIEQLLQPHPALKAIQAKIDVLFSANQEPETLNVPAFLNVIAKHLKRKEPFAILKCYAPTKLQKSTRLMDLHSHKPAVHAQLVQLLIRTSLTAGPPHPAECTRLLCDHLQSLMTASVETSTSPRSA